MSSGLEVAVPTRASRGDPYLPHAAIGFVPAIAQTITGRIDGRVTDSSGGVLPGATITIVNTGTGLTARRSPTTTAPTPPPTCRSAPTP